jgi:hypothetical protein
VFILIQLMDKKMTMEEQLKLAEAIKGQKENVTKDN